MGVPGFQRDGSDDITASEPAPTMQTVVQSAHFDDSTTIVTIVSESFHKLGSSLNESTGGRARLIEKVKEMSCSVEKE